MNTKKPLIIGEDCLDNYIVGAVSRLNPEAPSPILSEPLSKSVKAGMAANVVENTKALYNNTLEPFFLRQDSPIIKTRYCDKGSGYILLRVDENDRVSLKESFAKKFGIEEYVKDISYIIISDYDKGFLYPSDISYICRVAKSFGIPVFVDTKKKIEGGAPFLNDAFVTKINKKEYDNSFHGAKPNKAFIGRYLVVTDGGNPITILENTPDGYIETKIPVLNSQVINVCGAGDVVISAMAYEYNRTHDIKKSVSFGANCASISCSYFGTHVLTQQDITKASNECN